jgi:chorismate synthase
MLRFTTAGESHGRALVAIIEGLPAGLPVEANLINRDLARRQQGYGRGGRMKIEQDAAQILSGIRHAHTTGAPVSLMIENRDWANWTDVMNSEPREIADEKSRRLSRPRPGHADLAGGQKFGATDLRDVLERASARETAARVAAGALARRLLAEFGVEIRSHVIQLGGIPAEPLEVSWEELNAIPEDAPLRCADAEAQTRMVAAIDDAKHAGDTLGGVFEVVARGVVAGLGSHTSWDAKLDGQLAQSVLSIPAVKAFELGAGCTVARLPGSQSHDEIAYDEDARAFHRPHEPRGRHRRRHHQRRRIARARLHETYLDSPSPFTIR